MEGWMGKIIRVNLSDGEYQIEEADSDYIRPFLGGRGLGTKIFYDEVDPEVDPLSPENKLIFMTGPLTGTGAPAASRYMVVTKSPLTDTIASSNSGGFFGPELKFAGYDGIIFEGASEEPVYLWISDDEIEIRSAGELWGKTVSETEDFIRAELTNKHNKYIAQEVKIASIGPAGEKLSRIASIMNDKGRAAGRSGVGAVMGSKKLKAIVVRGTGRIPLADNDAFLKTLEKSRDILRAGVSTAQALPAFGTSIMINVINQFHMFPTKNWQETFYEKANDIGGETLAATILKRNKGCFACPIGCGRVTEVKNERFAKIGGSTPNKGEGPEYEILNLLGAACDVNEMEAIAKANYLCNDLGMDSISAASTVATTMELYEKGCIPEADMDGVKANFGNAEAIVLLTEKMGKREGVIGDSMAEGAYRLAEKYGHTEFFMGVKKLEAPGYDPRGCQGMGLGYATSNRGACHVRGYTPGEEIAGIHQQMDPLATEGKAALVKELQDASSVFDSVGFCLFVGHAPGFDYGMIASFLNAACGTDYTAEELETIGERIWNLEKLFNLKVGFTKDDDTLPKRLLEEPAGPNNEHVCRLNEMLPEYYQLRGWDEEGVPTADKLAELSLE